MSDPYPVPISILFVDPDIEERASWVRRLELSSPEYVITTVEEGHSALRLCQSWKFDCVVLEVALPDISGFEVLSNLCPLASKPAVAVVILTKLVFPILPMLAEAKGAQAYLMKSHASGDELDQAIRKAIATVRPIKESHA